MEGIILPYLPTSLWILSGAVTILLLFVVFGFYIYWRKREAAFLEDAADVAGLAARKQILQAEMEATLQWMDKQKAEIERLMAEREEQERLRALLADLEQQCATRDQENQSLRNEVGELENQRHNLSQTLEKLEREIGDIEAKRSEAQAIDFRLTELRTELEEAKEALRISSDVQAKLISLSAEKVMLEEVLEDLQSKIESARAVLKPLNTIMVELTNARKEKADLDVILETLRNEQNALERDIERKEQKLDDLKESSKAAMEDARNDANIAIQAKAQAESASRELESVQKNRQRLEMELGELNARKAALEQEIVQLDRKFGARPDKDEDTLAPYADLLKKVPICLDENAFEGERETQDETTAIEQLKNTLQQEGLIFSSRVIDAFHTSLKCHDINPITVLAGVSGTGKTLLPIRYAELMGMHRLVMAIQPRWDSPQDMFGFYNYLEKEYKATELSRALLRMDPYNYNKKNFPMLDSDWTKNRLLLVLLDEMNLARTEYYFSEFLSKLELRREVKDPSDRYSRSQAEVELDAGPGEHRFRLWVGHNIFFIGTLNEDETTQTLSDKVLDRSNVIRFGKPDEKARAVRDFTRSKSTSQKYLSFNQWRDWQRQVDEGVKWYDHIVGWTRALNDALDRVGRPFGFRIQQAIEKYVANYPRSEHDERYKLAFADQVEQKIIPKIRGIDMGSDNSNECLSEVESIIAELGDNELGNAFDAARNESQNLGMFQWRGVTRRGNEENI